MTIRLIYSQQYRKPCIVASPTDAADDVIAACRASGAVRKMVPVMFDTRGPVAFEATDEDEFVVQLRDDVGPELWSEAALRRSLGKGSGDDE